MAEIKNFDDFYRIKIEPFLPQLKQAERVIVIWKRAAGISGVIFLLLISGYFSGIITTSITAAAISTGGIWAISFYNYAVKDNDYLDDYKATVIAAVVEYLHHNLEYKPKSKVPEKEYRQSGLYRRKYDYYHGSDLIKGTYKEVSFHCCTLHTAYNGEDAGSSAVKIFKGLFFAAKVNSHFTGGTYIWIKGHEQLANSVADEMYRLITFPETKHYYTGNPAFDAAYAVYTTNSAEAAIILTAEMTNSLLLFSSQIHRGVVFSVVMGKCYVAIPVKEALFEPTENIEDREEIKQYFFSVLLILSIINQLNLKRLQ